MSKALVTGGAGFIGSNIVRLLVDEGYDVAVIDNLSSGVRENIRSLSAIEWIEGDIRDASLLSEAMKDVDVVFHLAASVGNARAITDPVTDSEINVIGTLRVLEAARHSGVHKVIYSSSAGIYGELKYLPINEEHPAEPNTPYGVSKLAAEKHCMAWAYLYGLEVVCLRYFNVYGINQRYDAYGNVIPIFVQRLLRGQPITVYGDGEQTRDFVNVYDVARANLLAARADGVSGIFNIGSGRSVTINNLGVAPFSRRPNVDKRRDTGIWQARMGTFRQRYEIVGGNSSPEGGPLKWQRVLWHRIGQRLVPMFRLANNWKI